ncbi:hypothetical protein [Corynebacterium nasicanis]|uniref:Uncharacterized protein n=1 Tax=Corynebacterium nasicanis TaxID=1448267 RepID=A0ABW1Q8K5_9CORY
MTARTTARSAGQVGAEPEFRGSGQVLATIAFTLAMIAALALAQPIVEKPDILLPAAVLCAFSLYSFFLCGRKTVTASSVASYGVLMFIGFPACFGALGLYNSGQAYTARSLTIVVLLAFLFQAGLLLVADRLPRISRPSGSGTLGENPAVISRVFRLSVVMFVLSLGAHAVGADISAAGFAWVAMLAGTIVTFWSSGMPARLRGVAVVAAAFLAETGLSLGGFGRLNLAVLGLSLVVVVSLRTGTWTAKLATALLTGPILWYLVNQRLAYLESQRKGGLVDESEGVGSVVGPFHSAGTIVEAILQGKVELSWGKTLFNAAVTGVPRSIWPDKPVGFGREIVELTQPWMTATKEHSDAGTFIGEAVWNFGVWLAPVYLFAFIAFIRLLDRKLASLLDRAPQFPTFLVLMLVAMLSGTLLNIIWGSWSTAAARTLFPLALLLGLWFWETRVSRRRVR